MPRLHKYRDCGACYVLTAIRGAVVAFQISSDGFGLTPGRTLSSESVIP